MSAMNYYTELLYLFLIMCWVFAIVTCVCISLAILIWCFKKIKKERIQDADSEYVNDNKR